jgi:hypothetical protein
MEEKLGKLIKSNAHADYICQIYGSGEVEAPPSPTDYAFATFVRIPLDTEQGQLVGVIYDTVLLNPDFGNLGPRLSPAPDLAVFSPDYLAEKVTLVGITAVGMLSPEGAPTHGVPPLAAKIDTQVERMDEAAVRAFHQTPAGGDRLGYVPLLLALESPLARHLLLHIIEQVQTLLPEHTAQLAVLREELAWQTTITPLGGGSR